MIRKNIKKVLIVSSVLFIIILTYFSILCMTGKDDDRLFLGVIISTSVISIIDFYLVINTIVLLRQNNLKSIED